MPAAAFTAVQLTPDRSHFPTLPTFIFAFGFYPFFLSDEKWKFTLFYLKYISKFYQLICQFWLQWLFFVKICVWNQTRCCWIKCNSVFNIHVRLYITSLIHNIFVPLLRLTPLADFKIIGCGVWTNWRIPCENPHEVQSNAEKYSPPVAKVLLQIFEQPCLWRIHWNASFSQGAIMDHDHWSVWGIIRYTRFKFSRMSEIFLVEKLSRETFCTFLRPPRNQGSCT